MGAGRSGRGVSRRAVVAGVPLLLASPRSLFAQGAQFDADCIVIGAGAAGLAAAHELRKRGKQVIVLEARSRVGGRIFTDRSLGEPYDAGAFYLHWAERNPWTEVAKKTGIRTIDEDEVPDGDYRNADLGSPKMNPKSAAAWRIRRRSFDGNKVPDVPFIDHAGGLQHDAAERALVTARLAMGEEGERVSALDYARLWSGYDYLVPEGFGTILERYAKGLDIRLAVPVREIDWSGAGVRIVTGKGTLRARTAILTVSVGVLQSEQIRFTPSLPAINRDGLDGLAMGASTRTALKFNGARFGMKPHSRVWVRLGTRQTFSFGCFGWNRNIVTAYYGGDHARSVIGMGERDGVMHVLDQFAAAMGSDVRKAFVTGRLNGWWSDPLARGGYSYAKPGKADARFKLATPVADRVFLAGEAVGCAHEGGSAGCVITAGGAFLSGVKAAQLAVAVR